MPPSMTPIPVPTDGTDAPHSAISTVTALRCVAESFDAVMDSLQSSIDQESERLDRLSERAARCRDTMRQLRSKHPGEGGDGLPGSVPEGPIVVKIPREYAHAIGGGSAASGGALSFSSSDDGAAQPVSSSYISAVAAARDASNEAVRRILRRDYELDDGNARMSDLWLDRPRAFDVGSVCRSALRSHVVPSLANQRPMPDGLDYYRNALEGDGGVSQPGAGAQRVSSSGGLMASGESSASPSEWDGGASVRTGISLSTRATNAAAGATASDRRRQRQLKSLARKRSAGTSGGGAAGTAGEDSGGALSTNRQQALSGSRPYLCEILHDAYGVGEAPPDGEAGSVFPPPRAIGELMVFNTGQPAYGRSPVSSSSVVGGTASNLGPNGNGKTSVAKE